MNPLYRLVLVGTPTNEEIVEVENNLRVLIRQFGLELGSHVEILTTLANFASDQRTSTAAAYFVGTDASDSGLQKLVKAGVPVIPVVSSITNVAQEVPLQLRKFNCISYEEDGSQRVATALLECVGLLPRQRRVFVSYRRSESRQAALQLFDAFSARVYDVFLDTHGVPPAEDFQSMLWHRLCDSDVLVMLDTPKYFDGRWTSAEYGRALAKGIQVLRIGWPGVEPSRRTSTAMHIVLAESDISSSGILSDDTVRDICEKLEAARARSQAVRDLQLFSHITLALEHVGGRVTATGPHKAMYVQLADGTDIMLYPTTGVPTSVTLNDAAEFSQSEAVAVIYDPVGLHKDWLKHLDWLGDNIKCARWIRSFEAAWAFGDWGAIT